MTQRGYGHGDKFVSSIQVKVTNDTHSTYAVNEGVYHVSLGYSATGTQVVTLPAISADLDGIVFYLHDSGYKAGTYNITVNPTGADKIANTTSQKIIGDGDCMEVIANNSTKNWEIR